MSAPIKLLSFSIAFVCILLSLNFGLRSSMGFFMAPISDEFGYGREVFAFALALQNLWWGLSQPFAGALADKYGTCKTVIVGALLYAGGLYVTASSNSILSLNLGAGLLMGMGIAATGFGVVLPAMAKMVSPDKRAFALGLGSAAGSAGQLIFVPVAQDFIAAYGWSNALMLLAGGALLMALMAGVFKENTDPEQMSQPITAKQTVKEALNEALSYPHYWLIVIGFFVCGFQLAFITVHMPAFLSDRGFTANVAVASLALIGLFNIFGCLVSGAWSGKYSKKNLLTLIYALRAIAIALFMLLPMTETSVILFSILTGFLWLATVPPTSGLVAQLFGLPHMGLLYGIVFLSHQLGSFSGVWLGGYLYDLTGSYDVVWWSACVIALVTAAIHVFIDERPVERLRITTN
ncbi:MFS transporter [Pseudoalteromonas sp. BZK2]|uniref:MFS transporter n=1 Tax=Pseudoalteromonas lipolytica TaxID=570156 RepID=A0A0P7E6Q8_9GAMM|nr:MULTISPECIES: MFS transporter [Pseudoalteromonas]KPM83027.1 MFS transporter [Pseudoalteromonas lipolytica]MBC7008140.1 MFS transporter [Pseudoalteromonas sp. BZK2]TMP18702.1 MFS transporter [Pseudoalteromonas sp. S2721]|tara:strand:+ start:4378 stop:5595 length:1218 start_codon:yes stop_codon:yes gene_type:complete